MSTYINLATANIKKTCNLLKEGEEGGREEGGREGGRGREGERERQRQREEWKRQTFL